MNIPVRASVINHTQFPMRIRLVQNTTYCLSQEFHGRIEHWHDNRKKILPFDPSLIIWDDSQKERCLTPNSLYMLTTWSIHCSCHESKKVACSLEAPLRRRY